MYNKITDWPKFKRDFQAQLMVHIEECYKIFMRHAVNWDTKEPFTKDEMPINTFISRLLFKRENNVNIYSSFIDAEKYDKETFINFKVGSAKYEIFNHPWTLAKAYRNVNSRMLNRKVYKSVR